MRLPSSEFMGIYDDFALWIKNNFGEHNTIGMWAKFAEDNLEKDIVKKLKHGFKGLYEHWKGVVEQDGATDNKIHFDKDRFILVIGNCPNRVFEKEHGRPLPRDYDPCLRCFIYNSLIFRKYGYKVDFSPHGTTGYCSLCITKQNHSSIIKQIND